MGIIHECTVSTVTGISKENKKCAKQVVHKCSLMIRNNMDAKSIEFRHVTAEVKASWLACYFTHYARVKFT